jgi:hypothetical protein
MEQCALLAADLAQERRDRFPSLLGSRSAPTNDRHNNMFSEDASTARRSEFG